MAGDIGIEESIAAPTAATLREASAAPPIPVLHDYGPDFRIRIGPAQATARAARPLNPQTLSENEQLGLAALQLRESPQYAADKAQRPYSGIAWAKGGSPLHLNERAIVGRQAPPGREGDGAAMRAGASVSAAPRAKRLKGRIAVGVIMVSGPGQLALTRRSTSQDRCRGAERIVVAWRPESGQGRHLAARQQACDRTNASIAEDTAERPRTLGTLREALARRRPAPNGISQG